MAFEQNTQLGKGGAGLSAAELVNVATMLKELQGLNVSLLAGAAANTTIALAAIRKEDTIIAALNNSTGTLTNILPNVTINDVRASGTVAVGTAAAGDAVVVAGLTYALVANDTVVAANDFSKVKVGANAAGCASNLAAAINAREANRTQQVSASVSTNTVTVTAVAEGAVGNAIALTETGNTFTVSGATLAGGTATGGIKSTSVTNQVLLFWFDKK